VTVALLMTSHFKVT